MTVGAHWSGRWLFLGRIAIGEITTDAKPREPGGGTVIAYSSLPGAGLYLGHFEDEATARTMVERSANSRMKAMLDGTIEDVATAVSERRDLRKVGRAIWGAGIWTCDRPAYAFEMFRDLGKALGYDANNRPKPVIRPDPGAPVYSTASPTPDDGDLID